MNLKCILEVCIGFHFRLLAQVIWRCRGACLKVKNREVSARNNKFALSFAVYEGSFSGP